MNEEIKKYDLISKTSTNLILIQTAIMGLNMVIILYINKFIELNRIWNFCFIFSIYIMYLAMITLNVIVNFRVGSYNNSNIERKNTLKSNLVFSSNIIFLVYIFSMFMYVLMSIILFS